VPTVMVMIASVGFGLVPYFAKSLTEAGLAPAAVAFYRYALNAALLFPFLMFRNGSWKTTLLGISSGISLAAGWTGYVVSLESLPVSTAGVLYMTYPMFSLVIGWLAFRDTPSGRAIAGSLIIVSAALISMSPAGVVPSAWPALLAALAAPLSFGLAINILTRKLVRVPPLSRIACVAVGSVLGLSPVMWSLDSGQVLPQAIGDWASVIGIALGTALVPQLIYTINAPKIGPSAASMAGSAELPTMFVVGWLAFGEAIGLLQLIAGVLVLVAIMITPARRT
jgi:drug/metabolite transporter (DMT)-like permease